MSELRYLKPRRSLTITVHGESGTGKSWFADTAPKPLLVLDAEGGADLTPSQPKVEWDPRMEAPPQANGWQTCVVTVRDYDDVTRAYQWLNSGQHQFKSVVIDSLTEIQKKFISKLVGVNAPKIQDWGTILRHMEEDVSNFRDLKLHKTNPLEAIVFVCVTSQRDESGLMRPHVQGSLATTLPYKTDVVGAYITAPDQEDPTKANRFLVVQPLGKYIAKDRTDKLGSFIQDPNIEDMLTAVYGPRENVEAAAAAQEQVQAAVEPMPAAAAATA